MVKYTQTIRRLLPTNCLSMCDDFVGLELKGLKRTMMKIPQLERNIPPKICLFKANNRNARKKTKYVPKLTTKTLERRQ